MSNFKQSKSPLFLDITTDYNNSNGIPTYGNTNNKGIVENTKNLKSLFNNSKFTPFPSGLPDKTNGYVNQGSSNIHNDNVYNISITELIEYTKDYPAMSLKAADFAYLKDVGVYPNNRLMIARRFPAPIGNDLTIFDPNKAPTPLATLVSWVNDDLDFLDITFGEEWIPAKASFEEILNTMGKDLTLSDDNRGGMGQLGTKAAGAFGAIPLPGLMEGLQQKLFVALGIAATASNDLLLPIADPNLVREAMQRKVLDKKEAGAGLKTDFKIKMNVKYEQKYINGVDPTLVYFDIIANVLSFATSDSRFMYNESFASGTNNLLSDLVSGDIKAVQNSVEIFVTKLVEVISGYAKNIADAIGNIGKDTKNTDISVSEITIQNFLKNTLGAVIGKYKIAILGVIASLTGVHSTPWHITIGNPKRPIFSSGDMYMENVRLKLGPVLSYNDLPSSIEIEFELKNARSLGAQEIFNRFNTGRGRSYQRSPDIASANTSQVIVGTDNTIQKINTPYGNANASSVDNTSNSKFNGFGTPGGNYYTNQ